MASLRKWVEGARAGDYSTSVIERLEGEELAGIHREMTHEGNTSRHVRSQLWNRERRKHWKQWEDKYKKACAASSNIFVLIYAVYKQQHHKGYITHRRKCSPSSIEPACEISHHLFMQGWDAACWFIVSSVETMFSDWNTSITSTPSHPPAPKIGSLWPSVPISCLFIDSLSLLCGFN